MPLAEDGETIRRFLDEPDSMTGGSESCGRHEPDIAGSQDNDRARMGVHQGEG
jgi:hypothetical protein